MLNLKLAFWKVAGTVAGFGATAFAVLQPYRPMIFVGESMAPTYRSGEVALTVPADGEIRRGDIVVINMPNGPIVKRIAYVPGDTLVHMKSWDKGVYVPFEGSPDNTIRKRSYYTFSKVPRDMVYVLGDNTSESYDSRFFGMVSTDWVQRKLIAPRPLKP